MKLLEDIGNHLWFERYSWDETSICHDFLTQIAWPAPLWPVAEFELRVYGVECPPTSRNVACSGYSRSMSNQCVYSVRCRVSVPSISSFWSAANLCSAMILQSCLWSRGEKSISLGEHPFHPHPEHSYSQCLWHAWWANWEETIVKDCE